MCTVKSYHVLAERFGLFAVRPPSLSRGKWTWGCGITLDIFTHNLHGSNFLFYLQNDSVINTTFQPEKENMCTSKALHMYII